MNNEAAVLKVLFQKRFTFYKELAILKINRCNYFLNRCRHKKSNKHLRRRAAEYLMGILSDRPKGRGIIPIRSRYASLPGSIRLNRFSAPPAAVSKTIVSLI